MRSCKECRRGYQEAAEKGYVNTVPDQSNFSSDFYKILGVTDFRARLEDFANEFFNKTTATVFIENGVHMARLVRKYDRVRYAVKFSCALTCYCQDDFLAELWYPEFARSLFESSAADVNKKTAPKLTEILEVCPLRVFFKLCVLNTLL